MNFQSFIERVVLSPVPEIKATIVFDLVNRGKEVMVQERYEAKIEKSLFNPFGRIIFTAALDFFPTDGKNEKKNFERFTINAIENVKETRECLEDAANQKIDFAVEIAGSYFIERQMEKKMLKEMLYSSGLSLSKGGKQ